MEFLEVWSDFFVENNDLIFGYFCFAKLRPKKGSFRNKIYYPPEV